MIEVELIRVAHGGFVVGRHEGKVVFVTGGLPGERVLVEITESGPRFDRGKVVTVLKAAAGRVQPTCPVAGDCGGCDWQHASPELQRELKTAVLAEQLQRLAGIQWEGQVEAVEPVRHWRTRMRYGVDSGVVGLRARRSNRLVPLPAGGCEVAAPGLNQEALQRYASSARELSVVQSADGITVLADGRVVAGPATVHEEVAGYQFQVAADGFWQVHPKAAETLQQAVLSGLGIRPGEIALDLYCGSGLFAAGMDLAGADVVGVEMDRCAVANARINVPRGRFLALSLSKALRQLPERVDVVVLDPPRRGAGAAVMARVADLEPRAIAYVACDPASLARDLAWLAPRGYEPSEIRAFDLFPMTHHVESVCILTRSKARR